MGLFTFPSSCTIVSTHTGHAKLTSRDALLVNEWKCLSCDCLLKWCLIEAIQPCEEEQPHLERFHDNVYLNIDHLYRHRSFILSRLWLGNVCIGTLFSGCPTCVGASLEGTSLQHCTKRVCVCVSSNFPELGKTERARETVWLTSNGGWSRANQTRQL